MALFDDIDPKAGTSLTAPTGSGLFDTLPEPPGPLASGFKAGVAGVKSAAGGVVSMVGRGFGMRGLEAKGEEITSKANADAAMFNRRVEDVQSVGDAVDFAQYAVATALPSMLTMLAGAGAGRVVGGLAARKVTEDATRRFIQNTGMAGGAVGTSMALEAGGIYPEAVEEGVGSPVARSIVGGVVAGSLDVVPEFYLARKLGLLGGAARGADGRLLNAAKTAGKSAVLEGATEGAQTGVERVAAGQNLTDEQARSDYLNSVMVGLISGAAFGAGAGALAPVAKTAENEQVIPNVSTNQQNVDTTSAAAAVASPAVAPEQSTPLPAIDLNAQYPAPTTTPAEPPSPFGVINTDVPLPPALRTVRQVLEDRRAELAGPTDEARAKVKALEEELALPADKRPGRTKSAITKELMAARAQADAASQELRQVENELLGQVTTETRRTPRGPLTEGTVLDLQQEQSVADGPIQPPSIPVDLTDEQRQAFAVQTTPFERPADKVATLQGVPLVELPEGSPQPAPQPQPVVVPPDPTFTSSRGVQRQGTPQQKQRAFIENSLQAVDVQTQGLIDSGALPANKAGKIRSVLSTELEKVFDGTQAPEQVRAKLEGAISKAVKGRINKTDAETFTNELLDRIASQPREFLSKGKVGLPAPDYLFTPSAPSKEVMSKSSRVESVPLNKVRATEPASVRNKGGSPGALIEGFGDKPVAVKMSNGDYLLYDGHHRAEAALMRGETTQEMYVVEAKTYAPADDKRAPTPSKEISTDELFRQLLDSRAPLSSDQLQSAGREIYLNLQRLLGDPADLEVRLFEQKDPNGFAGRYRMSELKDLIEIATNAKDVLSVGYHEAFHRIEMRHLSRQEREVLKRGLKKGTDLYNRVIVAAQRYDATNQTNIASEIESVPQEARAYGFEMWKRGELEVDGTLQKVFKKIQQLLERVRNYISGLGFQSVEDIFRAADMGRYAKDGANPLMAMDATEAYKFVDESFESKAGSERPNVPFFDLTGEWFYPQSKEAKDNRYAIRLKSPFYLKDGTRISGFTDPIERTTFYGYEPNGEKITLAAKYVSPDMIEGSRDSNQTAEKMREALAVMQGWSSFESRAALGASLAQIVDFAKSGGAEPTQVTSMWAKAIDNIELPKSTFKDLVGAQKDAFTGGLTRAYLTHVSSGMNLARQSKGFENTFNVVTAYEQRKNRLIAEGVDVKLKTWQDRTTSNENIARVSKALLDRTVDGLKKDSPEYQALLAPLNAYERKMFQEATDMIAYQLDAEFVADQRAMQRALGADSDAYAEWLENRTVQVQRLKDEGYVPERRFGDHVVYAQVPYVNSQGKTVNITVLREQFESQAEAQLRLKQYQEVLGGTPDLQLNYGFKYSPEHDASLSYQQFVDMARRFGIELSQAEKERLAKAMISADSVRRNRIFRRKNVAGYSEDGLRVLSEFAVTMANKIAYSEFSSAISDAQQGKQVTVTTDANKQPVLTVDEKTNIWEQDGPNAGFLRQRTDDMVDFVMQQQQGGDWSRTARMAASLHFLGGSMAAAVVQASALPMVSTPYLSQFSSYGDAFNKVHSGFLTALKNASLRDIEKLQSPNVQIPEVDRIAGLRQALSRAAEDGTTLDTEIYQIMGQSRGSMLSKSRNVRRALETWMYPFREAEKINRTATFIAAYRIGAENRLTGDKLYEFARDSVYNTQNRFDEANRPALARNPIWAILFTFKATPIFLTETIYALHKQNPSAAVFMLLSLFVAAGINGLPFAEDLMDIVDTIAQRLFNSPFNTQRALKNVLKNASEAIVGTDLSGLFLNGVVNELTGLSFASRVGLGNLIPGTRMFAADSDYKRVAQEMLGPVGAQVIGGLQGLESLSKGNFVQAIRQGGPLAAQNAVKGFEQWDKGYAQDTGGRKLVDVGGLGALMQSLGFSSSALNQAYALDRIDRQTMAFYQMVRTDFTNDIVKAVKDGKPEKIEETLRSVNAWNQSHPDMPIVLNPSNIRRTVAEAGLPLNQRTLLNLPKQLRSGSEAYELTRNQ